MNQPTALRRAGLAAVLALLTFLPATSALAANVTVTATDGSQVPLNGATTGHLDPLVKVNFDTSTEKRYTLQITGPSGKPASVGTACRSTSSPGEFSLNYEGNGVYQVTLRTSNNEDDFECTQATESKLSFTINASVSIPAAPTAPLRLRDPFETIFIPYEITVSLPPGAEEANLHWGRNATMGADGSITSKHVFTAINRETGKVSLTFEDGPGRYTVVARALRFHPDGTKATPWSNKVEVNVVAPFDLFATKFPDARGPSYKLSGQVREPTARGKITISIAKGKRGGKFKRLGVVKIGRNGKFSLRFKLRKFGTYRLRYFFKGSPGVEGGIVTETIRITRIFG